MFSIPQSTSFVLVFKAYLSSDHVTEATGKTIAITISKAGGAFGNPNAGATNATEISSGWYKVTLDTTDTGTLGVLAIRGAVATIDDYGDRLFVVSATTGGLSNLDATVSSVFSRLGAPAGASISADVAAVKSDTGTILNDVNTGAGAIYTRIGAPAGASIAADIAALPTASIVKTQVVAALNTDTYAEPVQGTPGATITLAAKIGFLYKAWRNKTTQTATTYDLFNDDAATVDHKATVSDDGTTFTKGEVASGP